MIKAQILFKTVDEGDQIIFRNLLSTNKPNNVNLDMIPTFVLILHEILVTSGVDLRDWLISFHI